MKIDCVVDNDKKTKTFVLEGELDVHHVKSLKADIAEAIEEDDNWTYVLDMEKVSYLDSSGLGMLVYIKKEVGHSNGTLKIDKIQNTVLNVFKLTRLDEFFGLSGK